MIEPTTSAKVYQTSCKGPNSFGLKSKRRIEVDYYCG